MDSITQEQTLIAYMFPEKRGKTDAGGTSLHIRKY
jgi:hypothetical protein